MTIPLARQYYFEQITSTLERMNVDLSLLLSRNNIPEWQYSKPEDPIPLSHFVKMFDIGARAVGEERFGMFVANQNNMDQFSRFGDLITQALTVYDALKIVSRLAPKQVTTLKIRLQQRYNGVLVCRKQFASHPDFQQALIHLERYTMTELVKIVRLGAGPEWCPQEAYFSASKSVIVREWDVFKDTTFHFEKPFSAILVPNYILSKRIKFQNICAKKSPDKANLSSEIMWDEQNFESTLRGLLGSLQNHGCANINVASEIANISVRTMRRRLVAEGLSFRTIQQQVRYERAREFLNEPGINIAEISDLVGYANPQHFIRAFRRWAGVTPEQFRKCLLTKNEIH